jgi:cell division septal protein FtsQ
MKILFRLLLIVLLLIVIGGAVFLATSDIPSPLKPVEKIIPNDRFPQ